MSKLRAYPQRVTTTDTRRLKPPPKQVDPHYLTPEHRAWRAEVVRRAGGRCQWVDAAGVRCTKGWPQHRIFADHMVERRDGGAALDTANGMCLCGSHHTAKTMAERARRIGG